MYKLLKERLDLWLLIITVVMVPVIAFLLGLNFRVDALEKSSNTFNDFVKIHTQQQAEENVKLSNLEMGQNLILKYFKLTPRE